VAVPDPYRWLEDPDAKDVQKWVGAQNKATDAYFKACLQDDKLKFQARMNELFHYDKFSCVWQKGSRYFFYKKTGLQNQAVLFTQDSLSSPPRVLIDPNTLREDGTAALSSVYVTEDGNTLAYMISLSGSDWQTIYVMDVATGELLKDEVHWCKFSSVAWLKDGKGFFYNKYPPPSSKGKEDGAGTETEAAASQKVFYHRLGTDEKEDCVFWEDAEHPKWMYGVEVSDDGQTLLLTSNDSCDPVNRLYYFDLREFDGKDVKTIGKCVKLVDDLKCKYDYITNEGRTFYFRTNREGAGNYKVVKAILPPPGAKLEEDSEALQKNVGFVDVVPEDAKGGVLNGAQPVAGKFLLLSYLRDVVDELELCLLEGGGGKAGGVARVKVALPGKGTLDSVCARKETGEFFYKYSSFNDPGTVYRAEIRLPAAAAAAGAAEELTPPVSPDEKAGSVPGAGAEKGKGGKKRGGKGGKTGKGGNSSKIAPAAAAPVDVLSRVEVPHAVLFRAVIPGLNPEEYATEQVFYTSKDGTKVPMFLVRRSAAAAAAVGKEGGQEEKKARPTFLYGYGGFNISIRPSFSLSRLLFIRHYGGVVAIANIRGGGEYGEEWHNGGTKTRKQNVFDDFIGAAEYLVKKGLSIPGQIAINGGSNGGLLVAACINQRPELFGAAVAQVGVLDMLRFHKVRKEGREGGRKGARKEDF
jgi:prolyl oligopeptidase